MIPTGPIGPGPTSATAALVAAVALATAECTTAMNEQFAALMLNDPNISRFEAKIAEAGLKRKLALDALLEHIRLYGW